MLQKEKTNALVTRYLLARNSLHSGNRWYNLELNYNIIALYYNKLQILDNVNKINEIKYYIK